MGQRYCRSYPLQKIDVNSNTAIIDTLYGADNYYYFYPNIYVDAYGDIVLAYSRSNTNDASGSVSSPLDRFGSQKHNNWNQTSSSYLLTNNFSAIDVPRQE